jgi:hypothetical protein
MLNVFTDAPRELLQAVCKSVADGSYAQWELHKDGSLRYTGIKGRWRNAAKLEPKHYRYGVTFQYCTLRARSLNAQQALRATLHGRMLELLARHFLGAYSYIVFEPKSLED